MILTCRLLAISIYDTIKQ